MHITTTIIRGEQYNIMYDDAGEIVDVIVQPPGIQAVAYYVSYDELSETIKAKIQDAISKERE